MDNNDFIRMRELTTASRFEMADKKSVSYAEGSPDRLANFKNEGKEHGIAPIKVLAIYLGKHWRSFMHWVRTGEESSEGIESTIDDIQNYLDLARAFYREKPVYGLQWFYHDGGDSPTKEETIVDIKTADDEVVFSVKAIDLTWEWPEATPKGADIVLWRFSDE